MGIRFLSWNETKIEQIRQNVLFSNKTESHMYSVTLLNSRFDVISVSRDCATEYILFHTFLCNSQNYHPRSVMDDTMHCCPRPKRVIVLAVAQKDMK